MTLMRVEPALSGRHHTHLATEARRNFAHPFGKPRGEPHLLLSMQTHVLGADHSATMSTPGLVACCVSGTCHSLMRVIDLLPVPAKPGGPLLILMALPTS
ncbi:hypothetical protein C7476_13815 [Phyllobacterium bourgognense]|uniref:Uncharacterized protein n=1 Tax=Phyllobacterium bourgognense TaxID=314236 RepID=A0A368YBW1_9HYPH|nr:hypothetical protein C7476_13815 [Phyllobacterium bourgognense]